MKASNARRVAHGLWIATALLWVSSLVMILVDRPSDAAFIVLIGLPAAIYAIVGGLVARRRPENPIGWLFSAVGFSLLLWMFGLAYAQAGLAGRPGLGSLPGAAAAAWVGLLSSFVVLPVALPTFLLIFPDGHLRSRRWRVALAAAPLGGALMVLGVVGEIEKYNGTIPLVPPGWVAELPGIRAAFAVGLALVVAAAFAGLGALVLRFRSSTHEERQPLRLLVVMIAAMGIASTLALLTTLGSQGAEWSWIAIVVAGLVDGFGILIGIPVATAAAVLTYGLFDVGVVMKKTVVYVVLVIFFVILVGLLSLLLLPLAFLGSSGAIPTERELVIGRIATAVAVVALVLVFTFRPVKRLARRLVYGRRATRYEAMAEFSERLGDAYSTEDVLPRMAEIVRASTGADVARVWLHVGGEIRPVASSPRNAPMEAARGELPRSHGLRTFPVRDHGELLGELTVAMPAAEPLSKDGEELVTDLASQAGLVLRNVRLIEQLQESRRRIVTAQDERARKLERDLHDGAQQQLVALSVKLGLAEQLASRDTEKTTALLAELKSDVTDALENVRNLARGIYPPVLADHGLAAALEAQARKAPVMVRLDANGSGRYPSEIEAAVYFCCLEALQNIAKYANANEAIIRLGRSNGDLTFEVVDDGRGFDPASAGGSGLTNMRDRVEAVGGTLEIRSEPGIGTSVLGRVPVER
jgi:signal transduction histidine kinase